MRGNSARIKDLKVQGTQISLRVLIDFSDCLFAIKLLTKQFM